MQKIQTHNNHKLFSQFFRREQEPGQVFGRLLGNEKVSETAKQHLLYFHIDAWPETFWAKKLYALSFFFVGMFALHLLVHYVFSIYLFKVKKTLCFAIAPFFLCVTVERLGSRQLILPALLAQTRQL